MPVHLLPELKVLYHSEELFLVICKRVHRVNWIVNWNQDDISQKRLPSLAVSTCCSIDWNEEGKEENISPFIKSWVLFSLFRFCLPFSIFEARCSSPLKMLQDCQRRQWCFCFVYSTQKLRRKITMTLATSHHHLTSSSPIYLIWRTEQWTDSARRRLTCWGIFSSTAMAARRRRRSTAPCCGTLLSHYRQAAPSPVNPSMRVSASWPTASDITIRAVWMDCSRTCAVRWTSWERQPIWRLIRWRSCDCWQDWELIAQFV